MRGWRQRLRRRRPRGQIGVASVRGNSSRSFSARGKDRLLNFKSGGDLFFGAATIFTDLGGLIHQLGLEMVVTGTSVHASQQSEHMSVIFVFRQPAGPAGLRPGLQAAGSCRRCRNGVTRSGDAAAGVP